MATKQSKEKTKASKKTSTKKVEKGRVYISASFNNTLITITDELGDVLKWGSTGLVGFKGTRKSTPYAATTAVEAVAKKAKENGITSVELYIKGPGPGRDGAIRAFKACGMNITMIADVTPIPHNGPRPPKRRRV